MSCSIKISLVLLSQVCFSVSQGQGFSYPQQVPVCATVGNSETQDLKGSQGAPGKRGAQGIKGDKGERGRPGFHWGLGGCPGVTYYLPRDDQNTDYVRYRGYVPTLKEGTICAWVETSDYDVSDISTLTSYSTTSNYNELVFGFKTPKLLRVFSRATSPTNPSIPQLTGQPTKLHLCFWFSTPNRRAGFHINGTRANHFLFQNTPVLGGGTLILGQEQDGINAGNLDANQAFSGKVTNFMIWPRVLSDQEISEIASNCRCPHDYAVTMTLDRSEMLGEASYSVPERCPPF